MPRLPGISWNENQNDQLKKAVRNFNAKISRLEKKNPQMKNALPEKVSVRQMKELIDTRTDLQREVKALQRFTQRGAEELVNVPGNEYNLKITKWQKKEMGIRLSTINKKRNKRRKEIADIDMTYKGEELGYKRGELGMGSMDENALKPMKSFTRYMNRADLKMKWKNMQIESQTSYWHKREMQHKQEYIDSIKRTYNTKDVKDVIKTIEEMDYPTFRKIFEAEGGTFEFVSDPPDLNEKYNEYVEALKTTWTPEKPKAKSVPKNSKGKKKATKRRK